MLFQLITEKHNKIGLAVVYTNPKKVQKNVYDFNAYDTVNFF